MEYEANGPQEQDIEQSDKAEEQLHVYPRLRTDANFEQRDIERVE